MFNCDKTKLSDGEGTSGKTGNQKPIVLSSQRFEKLLNNANKTDKLRAQKEAEEEQKYRDYLKKGSDDLVAHFKGNIKRTQDQKWQEIKEQAEKKNQLAKELYLQSKENDEMERRQQIAKAQLLVEKLKPGARELQSAAIQSEVLRARNVQRNINEEFEKALKKQDCKDAKACEQQALAWIKDDQERIVERQRCNNNYKQELLQTINENSKQRSEYKKHLLKEQLAEREAIDQEIKAQIEKERAIMEKKRAALRKNALEAMKMVEQRRLRERMTDELEDRLCCVYNVGKHQLDAQRNEQVKQNVVERAQIIETNAKSLLVMSDKLQAGEEERLRRDISHMQLKFTAEEQEKIRKDKAAKQARIESYLQDLQKQKEAKQRADEEKRYSMAQRFKNTEVNCLFNEADKQERLRKVQALRAQLKQQTEEKQRSDQIDIDECKDNYYEKSDRFFFEYARDLMEDAQKKDRPLYPFAKVVQQYKRNNNIECERKTPKHLVSHLNVGCRQTGDSKADAEHNKKKAEEAITSVKDEDKTKTEQKTDKEAILENCLKVTEMLATGGVGSGGEAASKGDTKSPIECFQNGSKRALAPGKRYGLANDCNSVSSASKVRYSMTELKNLNQFAAPSVH